MGKNILIAAFPEVSSLGKSVAKKLNATFTEINVKKFPDSEFHLLVEKNPKDMKVVILNSMAGNPDEKIIETVLVDGIARDYGAKETILFATYLPYMRQDTHFMNYDSFSAKHIIELFSGFDKIIAIDPHLHRIDDMRRISKRAESITVDEIVASYVKKNFKSDYEIIGPDLESRQWSSKIAKMLKKKVFVLNKTRIGDANIKQRKVELDSGKDYIIIDDIISTGKTLVGALKMAKSQGAKRLTCIGIHGLLVNNCDKDIKKYADLITTNTVPSKYSKIDVSDAIVARLKKI